jgi:uncharacterized protein (TIGR03435 family)
MKLRKQDIDKTVDAHLGLFSSPSEEQMAHAEKRALHRLRSEPASKISTPDAALLRPHWRWRLALTFAAAALVLVFTQSPAIRSFVWGVNAPAVVEAADGELYRVSGGQPLHAGDTIKAGDAVRTDGSVGSLLKLADGSSVEMRSKSELALERADDGLRIRLGKGDVIVNAAKQGPGRHLYVQTKDVTVAVVGTVFLVNAEQEGSRVAVIEGQVQVRRGATANALLPGEQVATSPRMALPPVTEEISWSRNVKAHIALLQRQPAAIPAPAQGVAEPGDRFEVVSIRRSDPNAGAGQRGAPGTASYGCAGNGPTVDPGRIIFNNQNLYTLVTMAYGFDCVRAMSLGLISGGPTFVGTDQYVIQATIPKEAGFQPVEGRRFRLGDYPKILTMVRNMVEDRFKVAVHREKKEAPGYALTVAKGGHKLRADAPFKPQDAPTPPGAGDFRVSGATLEAVANLLSMALKKPVVDRTGITGQFPMFVYYAMPDATGVNNSPYPDMITAFEEQLGLKLEPIKTTVETLVIDHAEKPSEN